MKKIPTLFVREFENHNVVNIKNEFTPGLEDFFDGTEIATVKYDGTCCMIKDGKFYKRYDAKKGKTPPANAIACCPPDPVTGHWPHWVPVDEKDHGSKWHVAAYKNSLKKGPLEDGTYEAIGPHFKTNSYHLEEDILIKHGIDVIEDFPRDFEGIKKYLSEHVIEGVVFWKNGEPICKIKRSDFGFEWK